MGVQDVPEPFQNAVSFELVKQSAFMIDFRRILGAIWEGFGGQRLPPRTRLSVIKTIVGRLEASRSLKHHFGRFLEAKWYHFEPILDEFWCQFEGISTPQARHGGGKRAHAHWISFVHLSM